MNRKLVFLTSLVVLLSCFSAANAGFEIKVDIAKGGKPTEPYYEEWTAKEGWLAWHRYGDAMQHDATFKENIGGTGLTVAIGAGDGSSDPGTVLGWTSSSDDPICNTWIQCGASLGDPDASVHLVLSGEGLIPGDYWVYGYHNTPAGEPCMPDILPHVTVETCSGLNGSYLDNYGPEANDPDGGGVIVEANDADVVVNHVSVDASLEANRSLVKFYTDGSPVIITYEAWGGPFPSPGGTGILNAFIVQQVGDAPTAGNPFPAYEEEHACPDTILTWEPGQDANTHKVYFDPNLTEELSIFDDDFENGDANWTVSNWTLYDSNVLHDGNNDGNSASFKYSITPGSGLGTLTSVAIDTSEAGSMRVSLAVKHTLGTEANDVELYYYNGSGWDYIADLNAVGPNDVWRTYTDDVNESQYLISNFKLKLESDISAGEVFIDNVSVTNTWPILSEWLVYSGDANEYNPPNDLELDKTYYWRVDEVNDNAWAPPGSPWKGYLWSFTTETGKARNPDPENNEGMKPVEGVLLQWTSSCLASSGDYLYLGTDFDDVNDSNSAVRHGPLGSPFHWTGTLLEEEKYYWKVNGIGAGALPEGDVWSFQTVGYPLMHFEFDGVLDANVHDPCDVNVITDSTGNVTFYVSTGHESESEEFSELRYGEPNPVYNEFATSAHFITIGDTENDEGAGSSLLRRCYGPDLLDLDGPAYTIEAWVRHDGAAADADDDDMHGTIIRKDRFSYGLGIDDDGTVKYMHNGNVIASEARRITRGEWYHIAAVYDSTDPCETEKLYVDGILAADNNSPEPNPQDDYGSDYVGIGAYRFDGEISPDVDNYFNGAIDELRLMASALTPVEFLIRGDRGLAWLPEPGNGQKNIPSDANLAWKPGDLADLHDVYLGTDWDDVNDADTTTAGVYRDRVGPNTYDPVFLNMKTTWYWRVDEVNDFNDFIWKGKVWRFSTRDYLVVDDFETYTISGTEPWTGIQYTWWDGAFQEEEVGYITGSWLTMRHTGGIYPVQGGDQSMEYWYHTADPSADVDYAEAWLPLEEIGGPNDWTVDNLKVLMLFFYGQAGNDANGTEQMYVGIEDTWGTYAEIRYGENEAEDMNDIKVEEWQQWPVALGSLNDGNYAAVPNEPDLEMIANLYIGFGNRRDPVQGGTGYVYFDDLRLSLATCVPKKRKPAYDFSNNCIVDVADVEMMGNDWLRHDVNFADHLGIQVQEPCDVNLLGHWTFDEGNDTDVYDSSSYGHHGFLETLDVNVSWVVGRDGNALDVNGGRVRVYDTPELRLWVKYSEEQDNARVVCKGSGDSNETYQLEVDSDDDLVFYIRDGNDDDPCGHEGYQAGSDLRIPRDEWAHLAGTFDGEIIKCYINGELAAENDDPNISAIPYLCQDTNDLGIGNRPDANKVRFNDNEFKGMIDDVRIYDYGLAHAEVAWLATDGGGYVPLTSPYNIYSGEFQEAVNMKDLAELMRFWLEEKLWPE
jgi:hypothetical protein